MVATACGEEDKQWTSLHVLERRSELLLMPAFPPTFPPQTPLRGIHRWCIDQFEGQASTRRYGTDNHDLSIFTISRFLSLYFHHHHRRVVGVGVMWMVRSFCWSFIGGTCHDDKITAEMTSLSFAAPFLFYLARASSDHILTAFNLIHGIQPHAGSERSATPSQPHIV